jgi:hypothetical protein
MEVMHYFVMHGHEQKETKYYMWTQKAPGPGKCHSFLSVVTQQTGTASRQEVMTKYTTLWLIKDWGFWKKIKKQIFPRKTNGIRKCLSRAFWMFMSVYFDNLKFFGKFPSVPPLVTEVCVRQNWMYFINPRAMAVSSQSSTEDVTRVTCAAASTEGDLHV